MQKVLEIFVNPTPTRQDIDDLRQRCAAVNAIYCNIFYIGEVYALCSTPTVHVLLHLSEMLRACGQLTSVSQFLKERVVGESGGRVQSRYRPESNLYKKNHFVFSLLPRQGG